MLLLLLLLLPLLPSELLANIIGNGDFETGEVAPWHCSNSLCVVGPDSQGGHQLGVTGRQNAQAGPSQLLLPSSFSGQDQLQQNFSFSLAPSTDCLADWKVRVTSPGGETQYHSLARQEVVGGGWTSLSTTVSLPPAVLAAQEVKLYLEVTPSDDYSLDSVALETVEDSGDWEEEADRRIDMLRRREVSVEVRLEEGVQAKDLVLEMVQDNHAFPFGTAVKSATIAACLDAGEEDAYCSFVRENFNWVVDTYRMKWRASEPSQGQIELEIPDKLVKWAGQAGLTVRGHALLWAKRTSNPDWVQDLHGAELSSAMAARVRLAVEHFQGQLPHWDVINEMVDVGAESHEFYMEQTGDPLIRTKMYQLAKDLSPDTLLFLNDYGILTNRQGRFSVFQQQIRDLLAQGAPIDGLGLQSHFKGTERVSPAQISSHVSLLWEEFHIPIWVTEFDWNAQDDVDMGDHSLHAQQLSDFYKIMFSHEAVHGILMWALNIIDDETSSPNMAGQEYLRLYWEEWRDNHLLEPVFEESGSVVVFSQRGFLGSYSLRLVQGGHQLGELQLDLQEDTTLQCSLGLDLVLVC